MWRGAPPRGTDWSQVITGLSRQRVPRNYRKVSVNRNNTTETQTLKYGREVRKPGRTQVVKPQDTATETQTLKYGREDGKRPKTQNAHKTHINSETLPEANGFLYQRPYRIAIGLPGTSVRT